LKEEKGRGVVEAVESHNPALAGKGNQESLTFIASLRRLFIRPPGKMFYFSYSNRPVYT
jgi:hypothetical protein